MIKYFDRCKELFDYINTNNYPKARNGVIHLLQDLKEKNIQYDELVNHLIREVGLYQYIDETSIRTVSTLFYQDKTNITQQRSSSYISLFGLRT